MPVYRLVILGALIGGSRYGLTIGRPIVQSSTWHFTYAETLQFPYPVTVALSQLLVSYSLLLTFNLLYSFVKRGLTFRSLHLAAKRASSSSAETALWNHGSQISSDLRPKGSTFSSGWATVLEIFVLAIMVASDAVLSTYALSFAPLELYLLSRAFVIPVSVFAARYFAMKDAPPSRTLLPWTVLFLGLLLAAYRPNLLYPSKAEWAAVGSSCIAGVWPFQWKRLVQSLGERSQTQYQQIGMELRTDANMPNLSGVRDVLRLLQQVVLVAVAVLFPILLLSDEVGYISRNCYFLTVPNFWIFLFAGGAFKSILLVSSALFIKTASASSFIVLIVLIEAFQVFPLTYSELASSQWLGLALCVLAGIWFYCIQYACFTTVPTAYNVSWSTERSKKSIAPFKTWLLRSTVLVVALIILTFGCVRVVSERGPLLIPKEDSPVSRHKNGSTIVFLPGTDAYLGPRPPLDAVANFNVLIDECRGTYEHLDHIRDIHRCLEFLSTQQDRYIGIPEGRTNSEHLRLHADIEAGGPTPSSGDLIRANSHSLNSAELCEGPTMLYHIWWTGLPIWRLELFIKSYFYTQNLACSKLWIWINTDHHPEAMDAWLHFPRFQRFMPFVIRGDIVLKAWKLPSRVPLPAHLDEVENARYYTHPGRPNTKGEVLVADSVVRDSSGQEWVQIYNDDDEAQLPYYVVAVSDAARLIILHLHGGVYMDPDMLLLRDLRPLLLPSRGFAERWGTSSDPTAYNNGLLYLTANSTLSSYLLLGGTRMGLMYHFQGLGRMMVQEGRDDRNASNGDDRGLLKLENAFFDPLWGENDGQRMGRCSVPCLQTFEQIFQAGPLQNEWESFDGVPLGHLGLQHDGGNYIVNRTLENFYKGAWAVHMHNLWSMKYEPGSWIDVICRAHDGFFGGKRTNPYGERWNKPHIEEYVG